MARIPTFTVTNPHADPVDDALTPGSFTTTGLPTPTAPNAPAWMREQAPPDLTPDTPPSEAAASGVREVSAPPQEEVEDDANGPTLAELFAQADETKDVTEPTVEELFRQADKEKLAATVADAERAKVQKEFEAAAVGKPPIVNSTPEFSMWNMFSDTAFGRVLELAGEGWQKGYKDDPLGLGPETLQKLRDVGFLPDGEHGSVYDFTQMFNQQVIVPMVAAADVATRLPAGLLFFTAGAVGQIAEETGVTKLTGTTKGRLVRDIVSMGEMAGLLSTLYMPAGVPAVERRLAERHRADTTEAFGGAPAGPREPIASGGPATPPPVIPQPNATGVLPPTTPHTPQAPVDLPAGSIVPHAPIDDVPPGGGAHKSWEDLKNERGKTGDSGSSGPSAAGATGPTDHAGNINLNYVDDDASIQEVIRAAAAANDDFRAARRGVVTHEDTVRAADALGMTPEELSKRLIGQALNAEEVHAVRQLGIDSAEAVHQAASKYRATGSTSDLIVLRENILRHTMIQEHWAGAAAEAGRALNIFKQKIYASAGQKQTGQTIEDHLRRINDPEVLEDLSGGTVGRDLMDDLAKAITNAKTPREVSRVTDRLRKASVGDMFYEFWINGLLSGLQTHARNAISNTAFALNVVPETAVAGVVGSIRRAAGGSQNSVRIEEAYARLIPFFTSQKRAVKLALNAWRTEVPSFGGTKLEYLDKFGGAKRGAIPDATGKINLFGREINYAVGGKQVRIPGRLLMASDEYYKAIAYDQEISAIAWRTALKEKLKGGAFRDRVVDLQQNPTEGMVKKAMANADYQTFTTKYDKITGTFAKLRDLIPGAKLIVPFLRTPSNIMKRVYERTPLAFLTPGEAMRGKLGAAEQDMAIARAMIGSLTSYVSYEAASAAYEEVAAALRGEKGEEAQATAINEIEVTMALATSVAMAVMEGRLNGGGPSKPQERAVMYADGWMPNSIRVGDMLYSYAGTEPIGMLMSLAASSAELRNEMTDAEADKLAGLIMGAFKNAVIEKTFFKGPANFLDMLMNPEMKGEKWAQSMAASMIPSVVGGLARQEDPTMREIEGMLDAIQARVPFMSNRLPPKIDIWGKDIVYGGSLGPDILSPIYESKMKNDPVNIKLLSIRVWPAKLRDTMGGVELIGKEIEDWQRTAGALRYTMVAEEISRPGFNELELWLQKKLIKKTLGDAKSLAKVTFLAEHKSVADRITLNKVAGLFDEDEASYVED
jgi:hypothetical protein